MYSGNVTITQADGDIALPFAATVTVATPLTGTFFDLLLGVAFPFTGEGDMATVTETFGGECPGAFDAVLTLTGMNSLEVQGSGSDCNGAFSIAGTLTRLTCVPLPESEPNDTIEQPQVVGSVAPGECFTVSGENASVDDLDGYRFSLDRPQVISAILTHADEVNVDLVFFSVSIGDLVALCNAAVSPEICSVVFFGPADDLDIVAAPFEGADAYTLVIFSDLLLPIDTEG